MTRPAPATLRLFAAVDLPASALQRLVEVLAALKKAVSAGAVRWVRPDGIHLTLMFYGETEAGRVAELQSMLRHTAQAAHPMTLKLHGLGVFPHPDRPRVVWIGLQGELSALRGLQNSVEAGSRVLGFKVDERGFNPHLTLGRVNQPMRPVDRQQLAQALAQTQMPAGAEFQVEHVSLIRSELKPGGAIYTSLMTSALGSRNT